jgi:uridylate kinase
MEQHAMDCKLSPDGKILAVEGRFYLVLADTKTNNIIKNNQQLVCVIGGGVLSRFMLDMALEEIIENVDDAKKHFLAMYATRLNASIYNIYINSDQWKISFDINDIIPNGKILAVEGRFYLVLVDTKTNKL